MTRSSSRHGSAMLRTAFCLAVVVAAASCGSDDDSTNATTAAGTDTVAPSGDAGAATTVGDAGSATTVGDTESTSAPSGSSKIVVVTSSEPASLDPQLTDDEPQFAVTWRVYEALTDFDAEGKLVPILAAELPENVDDTTWRVKLRPDVSFSDGTPMNADAVVHTVERLLDPATKGYPALVSRIAGATKVDDLTVDITTPEADPLLPTRLRSLQIIPTADDMKDFPEDAIGTGPYTLESYDATQGATIKKNPNYWGKAASIDEVEIRWIPDPSTRLLALQSGEADILTDLDPAQADQAPNVAESEFGVEAGMIRFNTRSTTKPFLQDQRVREALDLAIDKQAIIDGLFAGYADPANCQLAPPQAFGTNPDLQPLPYDPDKARSLLEEAGATGETISLLWQSDATLGPDMAQLVADYWRKVGMEVDVQLQPFDPWLKALLILDPATAADAAWVESNNGFNDITRQFASYYYSTGGTSTYGTPEVDAMIDKMQATFDNDERQKLSAEIAAKVCEDNPVVFLYFKKNVWGVSDRVEFTPRSDVSPMLYYDEMTIKG